MMVIIDHKPLWEESMTEEAKTTTSTAPKQTDPQFIPKLRGKKVIIRLVSGGQPITGTVEGYNAYEILIKTTKGQVLVFKHAIAVMEPVDLPKKEFTMRQ
jgi:RNA chaperone Hfq